MASGPAPDTGAAPLLIACALGIERFALRGAGLGAAGSGAAAPRMGGLGTRGRRLGSCSRPPPDALRTGCSNSCSAPPPSPRSFKS